MKHSYRNADNRKNSCNCGAFSPNSIDGMTCKKCSFEPCSTQQKQNSTKYKDASTSPKSNSPLKCYEIKSAKAEVKPEKLEFAFSPKTENHYKRLSTLSVNNSISKNAGTSPKKETTSHLTPVKTERVLEKSNSLGETKPQRLLRTTRSLSPRPPVRHQHSIVVSDENNMVSLKISPNEEFEDAANPTKAKITPIKLTKKASSEHASPNLSEYGTLKLDDSRHNNNNKSTSCLIYVPSDPWTRMSASNSPLPTVRKNQKMKKLEKKSFSKPNLDYSEDTDDPWVWRSSTNIAENKRARKNVLQHQAKSLTAPTKDDIEAKQLRLCHQRSLTKFDKTLTTSNGADVINSEEKLKKKITRPKLQRSKSPSFYEELFQTEIDNQAPEMNKNKSASSLKIDKNASNLHLNGPKCVSCDNNSLNRHNNNKCEKVAIAAASPKKLTSPKLKIPQTEQIKSSLTVLNPNLLQPRHSFSTTPTQKDDELQLNIRRLSEQMKYTSSYFNANSPKFLNETAVEKVVNHTKATPKITAVANSTINDPLLETTC